MKAKFVLYFLAFVLFFFLSVPPNLLAQGQQCSNATLRPNSGLANEVYEFSAQCSGYPVGRTLHVVVQQPDGQYQDFRQVLVNADGAVTTDVRVSGDTIGAYNVLLVDLSVSPEIVLATVVLTINAPQSGEIGTAVCCSANSSNPGAFCPLFLNSPENLVSCAVTNPDDCPSICPAISGASICGGTGNTLLYCAGGGSHPALCEQGRGIGIESAIGCIPFETPESTTAFFIRWSLGVGGGIALFLIALSGIKIATTKGDPKRLQEARDTLTASITGLVLILLSVYLVRFLSETLLSIF